MNTRTRIGKANIVRGKVVATAADASIRILHPESPVYLDDIIQTKEGNVAIEFTDGSHLFLGRNSDRQLDTSVYNPGGAFVETSFDKSSEAAIGKITSSKSIETSRTTQPDNAGKKEPEERVNETPTKDIHAVGNLLFCDIGSSMSVTDVEGTSITGKGEIEIGGRYGSLFAATNGIFRYKVDQGNTEVKTLGNGDCLNERFNYEISGTNGANSLEIGIHGTTDGPIIASINLYSAPARIGDETITTESSTIIDDADAREEAIILAAASERLSSEVEEEIDTQLGSDIDTQPIAQEIVFEPSIDEDTEIEQSEETEDGNDGLIYATVPGVEATTDDDTTPANGEDFDSPAIADEVEHLKRLKLDLGDSLSLSLQDVIDIIDGNHGLLISGDPSNEVTIVKNEWLESGSFIQVEGRKHRFFLGKSNEILLIDVSINLNKNTSS